MAHAVDESNVSYETDQVVQTSDNEKDRILEQEDVDVSEKGDDTASNANNKGAASDSNSGNTVPKNNSASNGSSSSKGLDIKGPFANIAAMFLEWGAGVVGVNSDWGRKLMALANNLRNGNGFSMDMHTNDDLDDVKYSDVGDDERYQYILDNAYESGCNSVINGSLYYYGKKGANDSEAMTTAHNEYGSALNMSFNEALQSDPNYDFTRDVSLEACALIAQREGIDDQIKYQYQYDKNSMRVAEAGKASYMRGRTWALEDYLTMIHDNGCDINYTPELKNTLLYALGYDKYEELEQKGIFESVVSKDGVTREAPVSPDAEATSEVVPDTNIEASQVDMKDVGGVLYESGVFDALDSMPQEDRNKYLAGMMDDITSSIGKDGGKNGEDLVAFGNMLREMHTGAEAACRQNGGNIESVNNVMTDLAYGYYAWCYDAVQGCNPDERASLTKNFVENDPFKGFIDLEVNGHKGFSAYSISRAAVEGKDIDDGEHISSYVREAQGDDIDDMGLNGDGFRYTFSKKSDKSFDPNDAYRAAEAFVSISEQFSDRIPDNIPTPEQQSRSNDTPGKQSASGRGKSMTAEEQFLMAVKTFGTAVSAAALGKEYQNQNDEQYSR